MINLYSIVWHQRDPRAYHHQEVPDMKKELVLQKSSYSEKVAAQRYIYSEEAAAMWRFCSEKEANLKRNTEEKWLF